MKVISDVKLNVVIQKIKELLNGKANTNHAHSISEVTNLQSTLDAKVPTSRTINGKALTANVTLSASDVGAATSSHNHAASNITSGTLSSDRLPTVPVSKGGTGATTAAAARTNLGITPDNIGAASVEHDHDIADITDLQTTLDAKQTNLDIIPIVLDGNQISIKSITKSGLYLIISSGGQIEIICDNCGESNETKTEILNNKYALIHINYYHSSSQGGYNNLVTFHTYNCSWSPIGAPYYLNANYQSIYSSKNWQFTKHGYSGELPSVTTADNGKLLKVVNGVWTAVSIPNAEEASF